MVNRPDQLSTSLAEGTELTSHLGISTVHGGSEACFLPSRDRIHMSARPFRPRRGHLRQNSFERTGSPVYMVDLVASSFSRLAQGSDRAKASERAREAQPA